MAQVIPLPVDRAPIPAVEEAPRRLARLLTAPSTLLDDHAVDDWGRDPALVRMLGPLVRLRWQVAVGGADLLPRRGGGLLVTNARRWSLSSVYVAAALSEATGRVVRFAGRPDVAPVGAFMRRIGALIEHPDEVASALVNRELVVVSAAPTARVRDVGVIDPDLIGAAVIARVPVLPVASISSPFGRSARIEVTAPPRPRRRRGPLAEVELAEHIRRHLVATLDAMGDG